MQSYHLVTADTAEKAIERCSFKVGTLLRVAGCRASFAGEVGREKTWTVIPLFEVVEPGELNGHKSESNSEKVSSTDEGEG